MLRIKTRHLFNPFSVNLGGSSTLKFATVASEDNELIQAIEQDADYEQWSLTAGPDPEQLNNFWSSVEEDIARDPEWFTFSND